VKNSYTTRLAELLDRLPYDQQWAYYPIVNEIRELVSRAEPESGESRWPSHESLAFALQALDCSMGLLKERGYQDDSSTLNNLSIARGWLRECVDAARGDATGEKA